MKDRENESKLEDIDFFEHLINHYEDRRPFTAIQKEFKKRYSHLDKEKDEPLLLFDTCSHTGGTIRKIKDFLDRLEFNDVKVLTANIPDAESGIHSEASFEKHKFLTSCYPFGKDSLVSRDESSVMSNINEMADRGVSLQIRKEIKSIIKERLENPNKLIS